MLKLTVFRIKLFLNRTNTSNLHIGIFDPPKVHGGSHKRPVGLQAHAGVPNRVHGGVQAHAGVPGGVH
jgi:hypothetical protein